MPPADKRLLSDAPGGADAPVLVVDDEPSICWGFQQMLGEEGYRVMTASTAEEGLRIAAQCHPLMVVLDIRLPGQDGLTALPQFREATRNAPVVVMTAFGDLETAVKALQSGAADYLTKPFRLEDAARVCRTAIEQARTSSAAAAAGRSDASATGNRLVGRSAAMQQVYRQIAMVSQSDLSVLISGETGTGKELIAAAIHENSPRRDRPYLPIAPVALNPSLIESDLFGHVRGAFTGASETREGLFALAEGGTILLDEIGDLSPAVQVKLLRVLEQRQYTPVGDVRPRHCNVRILAATNCDLVQASREGTFREDLFYRLAAVEIHAPPLRERLDDLEMLASHFLKQAGHLEEQRIAPAVVEELRRRPWYGNVRELRNAIEHAAVVARGRPLAVEHLPPPQPPRSASSSQAPASIAAVVREWARQALSGPDDQPSKLHDRFLAEAEPALFDVVLEQTGGNRAAAADLLGIHRGTLRERLRRYGIDEPSRG